MIRTLRSRSATMQAEMSDMRPTLLASSALHMIAVELKARPAVPTPLPARLTIVPVTFVPWPLPSSQPPSAPPHPAPAGDARARVGRAGGEAAGDRALEVLVRRAHAGVDDADDGAAAGREAREG